ncbi:MAG: DUF1499 domain-containing protein [Pseudobdellovibrionaceae bacterium]
MRFILVSLVPLLGILIAVLGSVADVIPSYRAFILFQICLLAGVILFAAGILLLFRKEKQAGFIFTGTGSMYFMCFLGFLMWSFSFPRIADVATDVSSPPAFQKIRELPENSGRDMEMPEDVKKTVSEKYTKLQGMEIANKSYDEVYNIALQIVKNNPQWQLVSESLEAGTIEGVSTSAIFKFKDDFVIRIASLSSRPIVRVDMRSKSRFGKSDFGSNAKKIAGFLLELEEKLGLAPPK